MITASHSNLIEFLGLRRNTALLLGALVLAGTGERLWLGFAPKYLETLGAGVLVIGLFDALQTLLGAVYAYPGGWLTDRLGQRSSLLMFNGLSLVGYLLVLLWHHWLALLAGAFLFLAWSALSLPATFSVVASSLDKSQHTMGMGVQSLVRRVPMIVGPLAGGWLITRFGWEEGVRFALFGCIVLSVATALFQWRMAEPCSSRPEETPISSRKGHAKPCQFSPTPPSPSPRPSPSGRGSGCIQRRRSPWAAIQIAAPRSASLSPGERAGVRGKETSSCTETATEVRASSRRLLRNASIVDVVRSFNPTLRELLVSDILIRFCERIPYAFVILWAMNHGGVSASQYGWLVAIEMGTAMVCYVPVARLADKYGQRPFVLATFLFFTLFPLTLLWAHNFAWLALAFVVRGLKEFGEPARKALIIAESPPEHSARAYGAYYLIRDSVVTAGSFVGAWLWSLSPQANFLGAALCGAAGAAFFWWFVCRPLQRPCFP